MKQTTVRDFRNHYARVLEWVAAGQEVQITRHGRVVARVVPPATRLRQVDWTASAARRVSAGDRPMTARQSAALLKSAQGDW